MKGYKNPLADYKPEISDTFNPTALALDSVINVLRREFGLSHGLTKVVVERCLERQDSTGVRHTLTGLGLMSSGIDPVAIGLYGQPEKRLNVKPALDELKTMAAQIINGHLPTAVNE